MSDVKSRTAAAAKRRQELVEAQKDSYKKKLREKEDRLKQMKADRASKTAASKIPTRGTTTRPSATRRASSGTRTAPAGAARRPPSAAKTSSASSGKVASAPAKTRASSSKTGSGSRSPVTSRKGSGADKSPATRSPRASSTLRTSTTTSKTTTAKASRLSSARTTTSTRPSPKGSKAPTSGARAASRGASKPTASAPPAPEPEKVEVEEAPVDIPLPKIDTSGPKAVNRRARKAGIRPTASSPLQTDDDTSEVSVGPIESGPDVEATEDNVHLADDDGEEEASLPSHAEPEEGESWVEAAKRLEQQRAEEEQRRLEAIEEAEAEKRIAEAERRQQEEDEQFMKAAEEAKRAAEERAEKRKQEAEARRLKREQLEKEALAAVQNTPEKAEQKEKREKLKAAKMDRAARKARVASMLMKAKQGLGRANSPRNRGASPASGDDTPMADSPRVVSPLSGQTSPLDRVSPASEASAASTADPGVQANVDEAPGETKTELLGNEDTAKAETEPEAASPDTPECVQIATREDEDAMPESASQATLVEAASTIPVADDQNESIDVQASNMDADADHVVDVDVERPIEQTTLGVDLTAATAPDADTDDADVEQGNDGDDVNDRNDEDDNDDNDNGNDGNEATEPDDGVDGSQAVEFGASAVTSGIEYADDETSDMISPTDGDVDDEHRDDDNLDSVDAHSDDNDDNARNDNVPDIGANADNAMPDDAPPVDKMASDATHPEPAEKPTESVEGAQSIVQAGLAQPENDEPVIEDNLKQEQTQEDATASRDGPAYSDIATNSNVNEPSPSVGTEAGFHDNDDNDDNGTDAAVESDQTKKSLNPFAKSNSGVIKRRTSSTSSTGSSKNPFAQAQAVPEDTQAETSDVDDSMTNADLPVTDSDHLEAVNVPGAPDDHAEAQAKLELAAEELDHGDNSDNTDDISDTNDEVAGEEVETLADELMDEMTEEHVVTQVVLAMDKAEKDAVVAEHDHEGDDAQNGHKDEPDQEEAVQHATRNDRVLPLTPTTTNKNGPSRPPRHSLGKGSGPVARRITWNELEDKMKSMSSLPAMPIGPDKKRRWSMVEAMMKQTAV